jgi:RNA polymerase sigma-70 factor (ECF subfamily)
VNVRPPIDAGVPDLAALLLPHLDSAHNLARWLTRNPDDANDVVQEAYARALRYSSGFRGGDVKAWLLTIVRNTAYGWLGQGRRSGFVEPFDEEVHSDRNSTSNPEQQLMRRHEGELAAAALARLPTRFREILVLREFEGLSYREMSDVLGVPIGTVMSTLSRARDRLRRTATELMETGRTTKRGLGAKG